MDTNFKSEKSSNSNIYPIIAISIVAIEVILFIIEKYLPEHMWSFIEAIFIILLPAPVLILIIGRIRNPKNKYIKSLSKIFITVLAIIFILILIGIIGCIIKLPSCGEHLAN